MPYIMETRCCFIIAAMRQTEAQRGIIKSSQCSKYHLRLRAADDTYTMWS